MILGLGSDLADIRRIQRTIDRFGDRFLARVFTEAERERAAARPSPVETYARRWAAKEAAAKALGVGLCTGVAWREIEVLSDVNGKPHLALHGGAAARAQALTPAGSAPYWHVSLTDDPPYAQAVAILEARPIPPESAP